MLNRMNSPRGPMLTVGALALAFVLVLVAGCQTAASPGAADETADVASVSDEVEPGVPSYMVKGDINAPVTVYEWSDYECPYCSKYAAETWPQIATTYVDTGDVRIIFRDFPLTSIHPSAMKASESARCAGELGGSDAYWGMHDKLFETQEEWSGMDAAGAVTHFKSLAGALGVDQTTFDACLDTDEQKAAVEADLQIGLELGVQATPTFLLGGGKIEGAYPFEEFQQKIDILLAGGELPTPHPEWVQVDAPEVEVDAGDAPTKGDEGAPVTIIEFSDYQCPYCSQFFQDSNDTITQLVEEGRIQYKFIDLPLTSLHPLAVIAAQAAHCARDQGGDDAFFAMHDALFANQEEWTGAEDAMPVFVELANGAGLDGAALQACVEADTHSDTVQAGFEKARAAGLNGTPSFVVNGQATAGVLDPQALTDMVDAAARGEPVKTWVPWDAAMATATAVGVQE